MIRSEGVFYRGIGETPGEATAHARREWERARDP